jgi:hypothetical protein
MMAIESHKVPWCHGEPDPMHSWHGGLAKEDMVDVVTYIRALAPFRPIS